MPFEEKYLESRVVRESKNGFASLFTLVSGVWYDGAFIQYCLLYFKTQG